MALTQRQLINNARWREKNRESIREKQREYRTSLRQEALDRYGRVCAVCGFAEEAALQIDHIDNNGAEERNSLGGQHFAGWKFYDYLKKCGWPEGYQTLCANHNILKYVNSKAV